MTDSPSCHALLTPLLLENGLRAKLQTAQPYQARSVQLLALCLAAKTHKLPHEQYPPFDPTSGPAPHPPMPLHTYHYACGCRRHIQGRECPCFLSELLSINNPAAFSVSQAKYLPFNVENAYPRTNSLRTHPSSNAYTSNSAYAPNSYSYCRRHDRKYRSRYDCPDHIHRRQRSLYENYWEGQRLREFEHRRVFGRE